MPDILIYRGRGNKGIEGDKEMCCYEVEQSSVLL